jgi:hypothetical protein
MRFLLSLILLAAPALLAEIGDSQILASASTRKSRSLRGVDNRSYFAEDN